MFFDSSGLKLIKCNWVHECLQWVRTSLAVGIWGWAFGSGRLGVVIREWAFGSGHLEVGSSMYAHNRQGLGCCRGIHCDGDASRSCLVLN